MLLHNQNENQSVSFSVDVIIPVRTRKEYDLIPRLQQRSLYSIPSNVNFIIVDYGSPQEDSDLIKSICAQNNFKYIFADTSCEMWNASKARNIALLESEADYVVFEDIDLISHKDFYSWINTQIKSFLIQRNWPFFVIPVSYLTEEGSQNLTAPLTTEAYDELVSEIFNATDSDMIEFHAPASSYLVCSREHALFVGGYDDSFEGWGFEDSDFWLRLLKKSNIEKPREFYKLDTRPYSNQVQWRGWRSLFRIFADIIGQKGIYSFHKWHPIAEHRSPAVREKNHQIFLSNTARYSNEKYELPPLWNPNKKTHLFLTKNPHSYTHEVFKFFNNPLLIEENNISILFLNKLIKTYNIESVVFNNPYGNPKRQALYQALKTQGIPCYVIERGALPWSIYIDPNGFCAESNSYSENNWPTTLTEENRQKTIEYISHLRSSGSSLEPQSSLIGKDNLKRKLFGDSNNIKILFVALQSPSDTTTNFFCGNIKSYDNFINEIKKLPFLLEETEWRVVYKNHPLTVEKVKIDNAINVDDYHIGDILDACDAVALINSGVGVLAAAYQKPVYFFGQAFYECNGLNQLAVDASDLSQKLIQPSFAFDKEKSLKFISYLINDFYSFAKWDRRERNHTKLAKLSISENIRYEVVRVPNKGEKVINNTAPINLRNSFLFDRYRLDDYIERNNAKKKVEKPASPKPVSKPQVLTSPPSKKINDANLDRMVRQDQLKLMSHKSTTLKRKLNKLVRNPKLFFADYFLKRISQ
ncbi:capsular polysaccharide export protein, LipB/KpsS family [Neisseria wadsworthii]|uniref:Capsule polysaccharide biosynthesis protein n=1 Tax=Neisseria wadsworthii 9715 TaxID=1030841 RepID=G4CM16_9NEIS|nr:galactosyltransferase-related protein [Neisseria wadsworthii]EGZ51242.1 capsule polysaccharide biosynthesis protein [Neisseria wadsworthii 9715]QMT36188.1 glycosyltransferase [Neisseria wadsworthii]